MTRLPVLVAGIGNIFLGDDAFGVEVVRRLRERPFPETVRVVDFGIRGLDLAYTLLDDHAAVILVDALPRGNPPGTLCVLEPDLDDLGPVQPGQPLIETHGMDPVKVLRMVLGLGGRLPWVRIVGCEPGSLGTDEEPAMELSAPVAAAVAGAVQLVEELVRDFLSGIGPMPSPPRDT